MSTTPERPDDWLTPPAWTRPPRSDAADALLVADPDHPPIRGGCDDCLATRSACTDPDGTVHVYTRHDPTCPAVNTRKD